MCSLISRFLSQITRIRRSEKQEKLDFLITPGSVSVLSTAQHLLGACFNSGIFVVVGIAVKEIAGPSMILAVILGAVFAIFNSLSLCELCKRFPSKTSYYDILYENVGEAFAYMIAWLKLSQNLFMVALITVTVGNYIYYVADAPSHISWLPPHKRWAEIELDTLVFSLAFLVLVSGVVAVGLPLSSGYVISLFWVNVTAFMFMLVLLLVYAGSFKWLSRESFEPFEFMGTLEGVALSVFFYSNLDEIVEMSTQFKTTNSLAAISLCAGLLSVLTYYFSAIVFVASSLPLDKISAVATVPKIFSYTTFYDSKYVLSSIAFLVFILTVMRAYVNAQRSCNLLTDDGLIHRSVSSVKQTHPLFVLFIALLSIPLFVWISVASLIEGFCASSLIMTILLNATLISVQYQPQEKPENGSSVFPSWKATKSLLVRLVLCCGCLAHKTILSKLGISEDSEPTTETSKLVNWAIIFYIPSALALAIALVYGIPAIDQDKWFVVGVLIYLMVVILFNFCVLATEPRVKSVHYNNGIMASFIPLFNISLSCVLLVTIRWKAFIPVGGWTLIGT